MFSLWRFIYSPFITVNSGHVWLCSVIIAICTCWLWAFKILQSALICCPYLEHFLPGTGAALLCTGSALCIKSAVSCTICFSKCNRCASQKDCCLHCYCSRGAFWSSEHESSCFLACDKEAFLLVDWTFLHCEVIRSTPGVQELHFCRFSSCRLWLLVLKMHIGSLCGEGDLNICLENCLMYCRASPEGTPT